MFLLRHSFLLTLTLLVAIAILYRQEIFDLPVEEERSAETPPLVSEDGNASGTDFTPLPVPVPDGEQAGTVIPSPGENDPAPPVEAGSEPGEREGLPETGLQPAVPEEEKARTEEATSQVRDGGQAQSAEEPADDAAAFERDVDLSAAREAYWKGDSLRAIERYRSLIDRFPNDVEVHGELGNILFEQGRNEEAAIEYKAAIAQLIRSGERARAEDILRVLRAYDPVSAVSIERELAPGGPGAANNK
jgi:tetratricopeptide (TPR) repeat protein